MSRLGARAGRYLVANAPAARSPGPNWIVLPVIFALAGCARPDGGAATRANTADSAMTEGHIAMTDGARLYYRVAGHGPTPVILVPGLFLQPGFDRLAEGRTLVFVDPRNRGRSDAEQDSARLTIQQEVRDLEAVRRHFGFEQFDLVGYSYAGMLVVLYATEHPGRVRRLVQIGPVPRRFGTEYPAQLTATDPPEVVASMAALDTLPEDFARTEPRLFCEMVWAASRARLVGDAANVGKLGPGHCDKQNEWPVNFVRQLRYHFGSVQRLDLPIERVRALDVPVLTVHGTLDRNAPYGAGREWALTLPNARLVTVPGAAHQAWVDAPDLIFHSIDVFLRGAWPTQAQRIERLLIDGA